MFQHKNWGGGRGHNSFYSSCPRSPKIHILTHTILAFHPSIPGSLCSAPPLSQKSEVLSQNHLNQVWEGLEVDSSQGKFLSSGESLKVHVTASKIHWWDRPRGRPCHSKRGEMGKEGRSGRSRASPNRQIPAHLKAGGSTCLAPCPHPGPPRCQPPFPGPPGAR